MWICSRFHSSKIAPGPFFAPIAAMAARAAARPASQAWVITAASYRGTSGRGAGVGAATDDMTAAAAKAASVKRMEDSGGSGCLGRGLPALGNGWQELARGL